MIHPKDISNELGIIYVTTMTWYRIFSHILLHTELHSSGRSLAACELLYNAGYRNLFWIQGGLEAAEEEV